MPAFSAGGRTHNRARINAKNFGWPGLRVRHAGVHSYPLRWVGPGGGKMNVVFKSKKKPFPENQLYDLDDNGMLDVHEKDMHGYLDTNKDGVVSIVEAGKAVTHDGFHALDDNSDGVLSVGEIGDNADVNKDGLVSRDELSDYDTLFTGMTKLLNSATDLLDVPDFLIKRYYDQLAGAASKALKQHYTAGSDTEYPLFINLNCGYSNTFKHGCDKCDHYAVVHTDSETNRPLLSPLRMAVHAQNDLDTCLKESIPINGYNLTIHFKVEFTYFSTMNMVIHCWGMENIRCIGISTEQWLKTNMPSFLQTVEEIHGEKTQDAIVTIHVPAVGEAECVTEAWLIEGRYHPVEKNSYGCMSDSVCFTPTWNVHLNEAIEDGAITCVEELEDITLYLQVRKENESIIHILFITKAHEPFLLTPTGMPLAGPTPTGMPLAGPTPTGMPLAGPTPTGMPLAGPTPTGMPLAGPTPTGMPLAGPTPTGMPLAGPTPTGMPLAGPTPTGMPLAGPTPTGMPLAGPTPTGMPLAGPTPTGMPLAGPTPTGMPLAGPTPTGMPLAGPTPTGMPLAGPTPTGMPLAGPTPTGMPLAGPTPTGMPLAGPTPTGMPLAGPTPTGMPLAGPTPTGMPLLSPYIRYYQSPHISTRT